ncbi:SDR family NAD(P)-dependent oxidoreductase [Paenibacillus piri]|uniref:SDR family NAD(P)-dependent oxidoreductase n=1 Tax=Paenibacillus piri TaxID=2547395 RepID=UPI0026D05139
MRGFHSEAEIPPEDWARAMETNFFGVVATTREVLPHMRTTRSGKIINIGSVSGRLGFPGYGPYAASKFAVAGFSESLRLEMLLRKSIPTAQIAILLNV